MRGPRRSDSKSSFGSLVRRARLLTSEVRNSNQELRAGLREMRNEMRSSFDQLCRHIEERVKRLQAS